MINENCPLCGSSNYKILYDLSNPKAHAGIGLPGIIKKCKNCDLIFKTFDKQPEAVYDDSYAETFLETKEYSGPAAIDFFKQILLVAYKRIKKKNTQPVLLDIGSGIGVMLKTATEVGYDPTGVELSTKLAEITKKDGYRVINKNISEIDSNLTYDTITMMDIIEHLVEPNTILKELMVRLKPDGELIVYTPNHNSLIVKISDLFYKMGIKSPVENVFACTHTCFFTTKTLKKILGNSGYDILEVTHFNYDISRPGQKVSFIAKMGVSVIEKIGNITGFNGFRLVVHARV
jgi:2-polyprenyl-3-methyl-5-hydroxy-6-metoxy-1,4-benzoquinol methylase